VSATISGGYELERRLELGGELLHLCAVPK
jgi:hypothetical protein